MTVEEKRKAVSDYCDSMHCDFPAKDCKLAHKEWGFKVYGTECLDILMSSEKDLDKALELINDPDQDNVAHPAHYCYSEYEPKDVIRAWELNFNLGSAVKYISRAGRKDDIIQDLSKAKQFIEFEIEAIKKERGE